MNKIVYDSETSIIELIRIKAESPYKNLLCGLPTKEINKRVISDGIEEAKSFCETENIFSIEPNETEIIVTAEYKHGIPYKLPDFIYIAHFICHSKDLTDINSYYSFGLIWYQDELSINIPSTIVDYIITKSKAI